MESQPVVVTGASAGIGRAVLTLWRPRRAVLAAGAGIDGCHAVSMLALAAADPVLRRAGIADAATATAFTAAGAAIASARPPG